MASSLKHLTARGRMEAEARLDRRARDLGLAPAPSPVHIAAIDVMTDLIGLGLQMADERTPMQLRVMMRGLNEMKPILLEKISTTPPDAMKEFLAALVARIQSVIDTPDVPVITSAHPTEAASDTDPARDSAGPDAVGPVAATG